MISPYNRSISQEGSWFPKGDVSIQTPVGGDFIVWTQKIPRYAITIIQRVRFSGAFQVSFAIFKTFSELNMYFVHINKITTGTAFAVERGDNCRSIWEHPAVQTYDPWGLGSGQSKRTTQITRGIGHGLVGTRLSFGLFIH